MLEHYTPEEAWFIMRIINHRRPQWAQSVIMAQLKIAMLRGATLGQATAAAERATNNKRATAPTSIMWPEHWEDEKKSKSAGNVAGPRVCMECTGRFPADQVSKHPSGHGFICNTCEEAA